MAKYTLTLPKLGESISEATVLRWLKQVGESVEKDEPILEVATDKVDSEIVANESGVLQEILIQENEVAAVGAELAHIETEAAEAKTVEDAPVENAQTAVVATKVAANGKGSILRFDEEGRFYSPLVRNMAQVEGIAFDELKKVKGSGRQGRVLKRDLVAYLKQRTEEKVATKVYTPSGLQSTPDHYDGRYDIIEMDRMRSMIADHMVHSKHTSPHVTSYVEADVTNIVNWRNKVKGAYMDRYGQKITFTPIFVEAVVKALQEFPLINVSVNGRQLMVKKDIHIGLAAALPNGNLIVPVIKHADRSNLAGLTASVNDLVDRARTNRLKPDEIKGSTFTISNVGTFRNIMGTPIINQPEVAILATGAIRKRPAVVETEYGDVIAIRHMMYLSLSYDHRVVDGHLGGSFLARIGDHLEAFDENRSI